MTLDRLLAAALVLCSLPAFGQGHPTGGPIIRPYYIDHACVVPVVPWRVFPDLPADLGSGQDPVPRFEASGHGSGYVYCMQYSGHQENAPAMFRSLYTERTGDTFCYTIRTYVVARDAENSDSTHPAGYSTCQPSDRYGVKTTEMRSVIEYR
jgi:hypothetical protein